MVRTVQSLRGAVSRISKLGMQYDCRFDEAQRPVLDHMQQYAREHATDPDALSPLDRSDREEAMAGWLEENGMKEPWEMAPGLVNAGLTRECLTSLSGKLTPEALSAALVWLEADLTTNQLAAELESAACRISDLVLAMKQYSYMDQAKFQEIDIHVGLDSTLKIFCASHAERHRSAARLRSLIAEDFGVGGRVEPGVDEPDRQRHRRHGGQRDSHRDYAAGRRKRGGDHRRFGSRDSA